MPLTRSAPCLTLAQLSTTQNSQKLLTINYLDLDTEELFLRLLRQPPPLRVHWDPLGWTPLHGDLPCQEHPPLADHP